MLPLPLFATPALSDVSDLEQEERECELDFAGLSRSFSASFNGVNLIQSQQPDLVPRSEAARQNEVCRVVYSALPGAECPFPPDPFDFTPRSSIMDRLLVELAQPGAGAIPTTPSRCKAQTIRSVFASLV